MRAAWIVAAAFAWVLCFAGHVHAVLVDRVIAAVNNDVITLSELRQTLAFNVAVGGTGAGRQVAAETLDGLMSRKLLLQEAYRLQFVEVTEADIAAEVERFRARLGGAEAVERFLSRAGMSPANLSRMLGERLIVERFVERKIELYARVSRDEVRAYYDEHREEFSGRRFSEVRREIEALLSHQMASQQLDTYIAELRERAVIRLNPLEEGDGF